MKVENGPTVGILGGGQLGRMLALAAHPLGITPLVYDPDAQCPAAAVARVWPNKGWDDADALRTFARACTAVTLEFENIPLASARIVAESAPLRPGPDILSICQDRCRERTFLSEQSLPQPRWQTWKTGDAPPFAEDIPFVLKTARGGYDGKGQWTFTGLEEFRQSEASLPPGVGFVAEEWLANIREFSVLVARTPSGRCSTYPPIENIHRNHILDTSSVPARLDETQTQAASDIARVIAGGLHLEGLLAVELFLLPDGSWRINELAPRPHNSGHLTLEAAETSQFEQALRAVLDLPPGNTEWRSPAVMWNLLGHLWQEGEPRWRDILVQPGSHLHLYGKAEARPGRKMGHATFTGRTLDLCQLRQKALRQAWEGTTP
jgi:5-(carboxyamino)imidazole ribonucleotide synthase